MIIVFYILNLYKKGVWTKSYKQIIAAWGLNLKNITQCVSVSKWCCKDEYKKFYIQK